MTFIVRHLHAGPQLTRRLKTDAGSVKANGVEIAHHLRLSR